MSDTTQDAGKSITITLPPLRRSWQYALPFDGHENASEKVTLSMETVLRLLRRQKDLLERKLMRSVEDAGERIFRALTKNDDMSIEADYGAPIEGLGFFKDLIDPTRSFRYERVRTIEDVLRTHEPQLSAVARHFKACGYHTFDGVEVKNYPSQLLFVNGGVTRAFSETVRQIIGQFQKTRAVRAKYGLEQDGVILVPVPTYGLFLYALDEIVKDTGVEVRYIRRHDNGAIDVSSLNRAIALCEEENKRIIAFYDCNPNNPTGYIRGEEETRKLGAILDDVTGWNFSRDAAHISKIAEEDAKYFWEKPSNGVMILEDMAYEGLEHVKDKKPFSFAQVSANLANQTVVFKGVSKIGLPGARIAVMLANNEIIEEMAGKQLVHEFTASSIGVDIIAARYSAGPQKKLFAAHYRRLRAQHRVHSGIVEAFVDGLDHTTRLTQAQKNRLVDDYAGYARLSKNEARQRLEKGLPQFFISRDIECGFFMVLNVEALRGKKVNLRYDDDRRVYRGQIRDGHVMYWVFKGFGIDVVSLCNAGADDAALAARVTLSLPQKDLFVLFERLRRMHDYFFGPDPQVQLDLFRRKPFKGLTVA